MVVSYTPLISVIITNYNYERYVGRSIESVLSQSYKNIELIVIDDGSTDNSDSMIRKYEHLDNVTYIRQQNKGVIYTRNLGLRKATGEFFVFIDADDTIPVNFIKKMYRTASESGADVVYCDLEVSGSVSGVMKIEAQSLENFIRFKPTPICQLVRRSVVGDTVFDKKLDKLAHEDNDFFFALFLKGVKFSKSSALYNYYVHGEGRSPAVNTGKHYKTKKYLYEKYKDSHPSFTNTLIEVLIEKDKMIDKIQADDELKTNHLNNLIARLEESIGVKDRQISDIINSRRYRVGKVVVLPLSLVKKFLGKS